MANVINQYQFPKYFYMIFERYKGVNYTTQIYDFPSLYTRTDC